LGSPILSASLTKPANDFAPVFRISRLRRTLTVVSLAIASSNFGNEIGSIQALLPILSTETTSTIAYDPT